MKSLSFAEMSCATFSALIHSRFRIQGNTPAPVELELVEATPHPSGQPGNFSLLFAGPLKQCLPQQTYRFEHEKLGAFDLFIVPVGKDQTGFQFQAIFNSPSSPGL